MYTFSFKDTYNVSHYKKNEKFNVDYKVLLRLYEPIIGSIAMSLYLTLESEISLNKNARVYLTIARLYKLLQINDKQFNEAIEILKQYKLLTYKANQKKADDFLFIIHPTKTAIDFVNDSKLNNALQVVVDKDYYEQVYNYFIINVINEDEYVDIDEIKINNDYTEEEFYQHLFNDYPIIDDKAINENVKKEINRLKKLFKINYNDIERGIFQAVYYDDNNQLQIDLNRLNSFVEKEFSKNVHEKTSDEKYVEMFENERSIVYYQKMCGRINLLPSETAMINDLLDEYKISEGVLNVIINYYFSNKKNTLGVSKNYFKKVIEEMIINNVVSTIDAMNYFRNRTKKIQKYKESNSKTNTNVIKKDDNDEVKEEIDPETLAEFRRLMGG